jgi:16S rRNA (guanine966-N2)-methyltransferase
MRVIAGAARGRALRGPRGVATRPTSARVRAALFSLLEARGAAFDRVLDLFAGTGALAIEALSRGAAEAVLVEQSRAACAAIERNLGALELRGRARVVCGALPAALTRVPAGPYTLIFIDPPYATRVEELFARLAASGMLAPETIVVYEHDRRVTPPMRCGELALTLSRTYGDSTISLYHAPEGD